MFTERFFKNLFFLGIILAVAYGIYHGFIAVKKESLPKNPFQLKDQFMEDENLYYFYAFNTTKGPVCWNITNSYNKNHDSMRFNLHIVNPSDGKDIEKITLVPSVYTFESSDAITGFSQLRLIGNYVWEIGKKGLTARDPLTGKIMISEKSLQEQFPELNAGIGSGEYYWWGNSIKLTTKDGFIYYFIPAFNKLMNEADFETQRTRKDKANILRKTTYVFTEDIRRQLYKVNAPSSIYENEVSFSTSYLKYFEEDNKYFKRHYNMYDIKKIYPDRVFINGIVLDGDSNMVCIAYQKEATEDSPIIIEGIFDNGRNWILGDSSLNCLKDAIKNNYVEYASLQNHLLVIKVYQKCCLGIETAKGNLLWNYRPNY